MQTIKAPQVAVEATEPTEFDAAHQLLRCNYGRSAQGYLLPVDVPSLRSALECAVVDLFWAASKMLMEAEDKDAALNEILALQPVAESFVNTLQSRK